MLPTGLRARLEQLFPGATIDHVTALRDDESSGEAMKALGYGKPLRIELTVAGARQSLVFHTARADDFGHDRRSDRVGNLVLAFDTFGKLPNHVRAIDAGVVRDDGALVSIAGTGEPYLLTTWVDGMLYADELRRIAKAGKALSQDLVHAERLATLLLEIHSVHGSHAGAYTRAIRDLLGHGEGIFGLVDSYAPSDLTPRLRRLEEACLRWRWKLRDRTERLRRTHGDCHPFNIIVADDVYLLDASRGSEGDPADDVACLTINFLFMGVGHPRWAGGLGTLWERFWQTYLAGDRVDVLAAVAPFYAWRALVLASPKWYPHTADADRDRILTFAERALAAERFDPAWGAEAMA
ncbi:MAG TPA: phosphotransferase [Kofleriaceae bacterium]|nr:phosphotransferase [Kofleriaceae bacterium]